MSFREGPLVNALKPAYRRLRRWRDRLVAPEYICATHYFADGWALNFLQVVDSSTLRRDFRQIKADGFNTVIIVVPWRGFQTDHYSPAYDAFYVEQLKRVMSAAQVARLAVIVRVSYAHQILDEHPLSGLTMMQRLLTDDDTQSAWLDYCEKVYRICSDYGCFLKCFLSWEEFWHAFWRWQLYKPEFREELAKEIGFSQYLEQLGIEGISSVPRPEEPQYDVFHAFVNSRIRDMHTLASSRVPALGMEIRVDKDRHLGPNETVSWLVNDNFAELAITRFTYWAPFMGAKNNGETLSSDEAIHLLEHALDEWTDFGRNPDQIIDQFNFVDDAPKFRGIHARIADAEVGDFLSHAVPLLRQRSRGYGIWAYRDYRQNLLFNPRFINGLSGWSAVSGKAVTQRDGGVRLSGGAVLRQYMPAQVAGLQRAVTFNSLTFAVRFRDAVTGSARLQVRINAGAWLPLENEEQGEYAIEIPVKRPMILEDGIVLELRQSGAPVSVDRLFLYHVVFRGGFRRENGDPSIHHEHVVMFNRSLAQFTPGESRVQD